MNKTLTFVLIAFAVLLLLGIAGIHDNPSLTNATSLTPEQRAEAQRLASESLVRRNDGTISSLSQKDAEMMVETCAALRKMKFSDMTPQALSVWDTCRSHGLDH